jgi:uridine phosphorylase
MRKNLGAAAIAIALLAASACSAQDATSTETMSAEKFYEQVQVGNFASMTEEGLDEIAQAFCNDLDKMDAEMRSATVIVVRDSVETDLEAFEVAQAFTSRWCPEHRDAFDL